MATVLCAGGESLHTRHPLLKNAGFDVLTATTEDALLTAGRLPDVDAVILDSSSSIGDLAGVAAELKRAHPSLPVLLVTDAGDEDVTQSPFVFDRVISRLDGPAVLIRTLRELTLSVVSISEAMTCSAAQTFARTQQLRVRVEEMKGKISRLRLKLALMRTRW